MDAISLMSAPAAKARSEPVMTMQWIAASSSAACSAALSSAVSWAFRAFSAWGLFRRISRVVSWVSTIRVS